MTVFVVSVFSDRIPNEAVRRWKEPKCLLWLLVLDLD